MMLVDLAPHATVVLLTLAAAITDLRTGRIPNWITLPPLLAAPLVFAVLGGPVPAASSVAAALLCGVVPYALFRRGAMGGGDVKLLAAIGAVTAWPGGPNALSLGLEAQLYALTLCCLFVACRLAVDGRLVATLGRALGVAFGPLLPERWRRPISPELMTSVRLGPAIFAGTLLALALRSPFQWP